MTAIFVDTSAWVAGFNRDEREHRAVARVLRDHRRRLATSNLVLNETLTLLRYRFSWSMARAFGEEVRSGNASRVLRVEVKDEDAAWEIFLRYADHRFSFTDCTSFALMRRYNLGTALTLDADFSSFGMHVLP